MLLFSTDPGDLDRNFIHDFLSQSYWATGRTKEETDRIIDHSVNFGVFLDGRQIGYARAVTDTVQFAYIMDVFITPEQRGNGYSQRLMEFLLEHDSMKDVKIIRLATKDAHGLYERFGFKPLEHVDRMMERVL